MHKIARAGAVALLAFSMPAMSGSVGKYAVSPITQKAYPKLYAQWGKSGIDRINALLKPAAQMMADSPECDELEIIDVSSARSRPKNTIVLYGDCKNGKRFYLSEKEIVAKKAAVSQNKKSAAVKDSDLLKACKDAIRGRLNYPSTFDPGWFGGTVYRAPAGRIVASIDFEAKNGLGAALPHTGKCYTDGGVMNSVEIMPR